MHHGLYIEASIMANKARPVLCCRQFIHGNKQLLSLVSRGLDRAEPEPDKRHSPSISDILGVINDFLGLI